MENYIRQRYYVTTKIKCENCNIEYQITKSALKQYYNRNKSTKYICLSCKNKSRIKPNFKIVKCVRCNEDREISRKSKKCKLCIKCWLLERTERARQANIGHHRAVTQNTKAKISATIQHLYENNIEFKQIQFGYRNDTWRKKISDSIRFKWSKGDYEQVRTGNMRNTWLQRSMKLLCESLNLDYKEEFVVDVNIPYSFDFKIDNLLIELDGDYWHSLKNVHENDLRKSNWIANNHPEYKLIRIKEHEAKCSGKLYQVIINNLPNIMLPQFKLQDLIISKINQSIAVDFINSIHYLGKPRPGGIPIGASLNNKLIAVCYFQRPIRVEVATSSGYKWDDTYEISRLAVVPGYNKKNLISYFITRAIKLLPPTKLIVAFADSTVGHIGTCYKASNFVLEKIVKPDYYYEKDGLIMHKKTLWDHAKKMKILENDYAKQYNFIKIITGEKYKYTLKV